MAGLAYKKLIDCNKDIKKLVLPEFEKYVRKATIGGRAQCFYKHTMFESDSDSNDYRDNFMVQLDINSSYSDCMKNNRFPTSLPKFTNVYMPFKLGIYKVNIISQQSYSDIKEDGISKKPLYKHTVVPHRICPDEPWNYDNHDMQFTTWVTNIEIGRMSSLHFHFEVIKGYYFEEDSTDVFTDFVNSCYSIRNKYKLLKKEDPKYIGYENIIKLAQNAPTGKLGQRGYTDDILISDNSQKVEKFLIDRKDTLQKHWDIAGTAYVTATKEVDTPSNKPCVYMCFIYAYARDSLYKKFLSKGICYQVDTDSAVVSKQTYNKLLKSHPHYFGLDIGQLKVEVQQPFNLAYFIRSKIYGFFNRNKSLNKYESVKFVAKGFNTSDKFIYGHIEQYELESKSWIEQDITNGIMHNDSFITPEKSINILPTSGPIDQMKNSDYVNSLQRYDVNSIAFFQALQRRLDISILVNRVFKGASQLHDEERPNAACFALSSRLLLSWL
jgi:hypothetical protein